MEEVKAKLATLISEKRRSPDNGASWEQAYQSTFEHLDRLGIGDDAISRELNVIHVAGTKGKGSTSAFCESILRRAGYRTGLFTSPHLVNVNERIRLDGKPISDEAFCRYFWEVWALLEERCTPEVGMPAYFRFLTLLGYYVFIKEGVDAAVIEVGLGGRIDSTNVVRRPVVCGVASLGFDHTELLGDTLAKIAREKAGIFKEGARALTIPQEPEAMATLEACGREKGADLKVAPPLWEYAGPFSREDPPKLGILGQHQQTNAALAVALCAVFQQKTEAHEKLAGRTFSPVLAPASNANVNANTDPDELSLTPACLEGLARCSWPGRGQVETDVEGYGPNVTFYLDGAHTGESMLCCANWYRLATKAHLGNAGNVRNVGNVGSASASASASAAAAAATGGERWLVFNCMKDRDPNVLLGPLAGAGAPPFNRTLFVPFLSSTTSFGQNANPSDLKWQEKLMNVWLRMTGGQSQGAAGASATASRTALGVGGGAGGEAGPVSVSSVGAALATLKTYAKQNNTKQIHVLVTGSLYLVGDLLRILQRIP